MPYWTVLSVGKEWIDKQWKVVWVSDEPITLSTEWSIDKKKDLIKEWERLLNDLKKGNTYKKQGEDLFVLDKYE